HVKVRHIPNTGSILDLKSGNVAYSSAVSMRVSSVKGKRLCKQRDTVANHISYHVLHTEWEQLDVWFLSGVNNIDPRSYAKFMKSSANSPRKGILCESTLIDM